MQRIFVMCKLKGMSDVASATAAGLANPDRNAHNMKKSKSVQEAIRKGIEALANEVMFTRHKAHDLLMDAHRNAATSTEQVLAIRELIKLHGVAAPEVKEIHQKHSGMIDHREVKELTDAELLKLADFSAGEHPSIIEGEYEVIEGDSSPGENNLRENGKQEGREKGEQEEKGSS